MVNTIESREQNIDKKESANSLAEQCNNLDNQLINTEKTSKEKQEHICQNYTQLPADPKELPIVNQLDESEEREITKNNEEHNNVIKKSTSQLAQLESNLELEGTQNNTGSEEVELSTMDYLTNQKAIAANNTDISEASSNADDVSSIA